MEPKIFDVENFNEFNAKESFDHYMNPQTRFGDLQKGTIFRFPGQKTIQVRTASGYRHQNGSPVWRTGARVAVIVID